MRAGRSRKAAGGHSKQIKSDFILRGLVERSISWCLVLVSAAGPFMRACSPFAALMRRRQKKEQAGTSTGNQQPENHLNKAPAE